MLQEVAPAAEETAPAVDLWTLGLQGGSLVVVGLLLLAWFGARLWRQGPSHPPRPPWSGSWIGLSVALGLAGLVLTSQQLSQLAEGRGVEFSELGPSLLLGSTAIWQLLAVLPALVLASHSSEARKELGLVWRGSLRPLWPALVLYLCAVPLMGGVLKVWEALQRAVGRIPPPQLAGEVLLSAEGHELVMGAILAVLIVPLLEELFFRGWLQPFLSEQFGGRIGVLATSLTFGLVHGWTALPPIFVLALVLGTVRHRSGRLAPAVFLHALHNGGMLALMHLAPVSCVPPYWLP